MVAPIALATCSSAPLVPFEHPGGDPLQHETRSGPGRAGRRSPPMRIPAGEATERARECSEGAHLAVAPRCAKKFTSPGPAPITSAEPAETSARHPAAGRVVVAVGVRGDRPHGGADEGAEQGDRQRPGVGSVDDLLQDVAAGKAGGVRIRADVGEGDVHGVCSSCMLNQKQTKN